MTGLLVAVVFMTPTAVRADGTIDHETGDIEVATKINGVVYTTGGSGPRCEWLRWSQGQYEDYMNITNTFTNARPEPLDPDIEHTPEEHEQHAAEVAAWDQRFEQDQIRRSRPSSFGWQQGDENIPHGMFTVRCPDGPDSFRFVDLSVSATDLMPGAEAIARGRVPLPVPLISPSADNGGWVNLGMWLAAEPQAVEPITAEAGPNAWITVTPTHERLIFDFGNGDSVECAGFGIPIEAVHPDLDTTEASPTCGYTYRTSSPDDQPYQLSSGAIWALPYDSSEGSGHFDPFIRTISDAYDVDELQTIGVQN